MKRLFCIFFCLFAPLFSGETDAYQFKGKHFIASYLECDQEALGDVEALLAYMEKAVIASGATLLSSAHHVFPPNGLTAVYLLSESHASIHTYPEAGACFVDLFTCGDHTSSEIFDKMLREFLKPERVDSHLYIRSEDFQKIPVHVHQ